MKHTMKLLAFILTLSMLLGILAACTPTPENPNGTNEVTTAPEIDTNDPSSGDDPELELVKIINAEQFSLLASSLNENPEASKGKKYKLYVDVTLLVGWDASPSSAYGKFVGPGEIAKFPGISEFYGVFDGNGKTISCIYRVDSETAGGAVGGFIDKLNGGTVSNLTFNSAYVYDDGAAGAPLGGLIGVVNGNGALVENVTVNANVYAASDDQAIIGGVVGAVQADGFAMKNVTFGGKAGVIGADMSIPSASTAAVLGQLIGDAGDKAVTLTDCKANGALLCNAGATKGDYVGKGTAITSTGCSVTAPADADIVEITEYQIFSAAELMSIAAYNSTFEGRTIKLMADINLNEGWSAGATAPTNVWTGISEFKGTFDGNSKILTGVYRKDTDGGDVGFIDKLNGGTVKNLIVLNSAIVSDSAAAANVGFIGNAVGGKVENVAIEADIYASGTGTANAGGIIGAATGATKLDSVLYNGDISAADKTAGLIVASTTDAALTDVLALGTGASMTNTGTRVLAEKKGEADLTGDYATAWGYTTYLQAIAPNSLVELLKVVSAFIPDTSWYSDEATVFEISTPEQLLGLSVLAQTVYDTDGETVLTQGKDFAGKTIKLMANIDLNPGWDATTTVASNGVVTVAITPKNIWTSIPVFKGTIEGQGYTINGIYSYSEIYAPSDFKYWGGFINELQDGAIKNLIVKNSLAYFTKTEGTTKGTSKINIGGFIGRVTDSVLETLFVDMDAWNKFEYHYTMGGMICAVHTNADDNKYVGSIANIVFAGTSGRIGTDGTWNKAEAGNNRIYTAGMIAQNHITKNGADFCYITMQNLSFIGLWYRPVDEVVTGDPLLGFTGSQNYSSGIAVNNTSIYIDETVAGADAAGEFNTTTSLESTPRDFTNNSGVVDDADTYKTNDAWTTMDIETGAGVNTGIVLPKTVVDMLNAANNAQ